MVRFYWCSLFFWDFIVSACSPYTFCRCAESITVNLGENLNDLIPVPFRSSLFLGPVLWPSEEAILGSEEAILRPLSLLATLATSSIRSPGWFSILSGNFMSAGILQLMYIHNEFITNYIQKDNQICKALKCPAQFFINGIRYTNVNFVIWLYNYIYKAWRYTWKCMKWKHRKSK